jgi:serine/threonine-protein kinase HipA
VLINNRQGGRLEKAPNGAVAFQYDSSWLDWEHGFAASLSLPLQKVAYRGAEVTAVFDDLLRDNFDIRRLVAERTGAEGTLPYSLLAQIGRDCVGAMQFLRNGETVDASGVIHAELISEIEIEQLLAELKVRRSASIQNESSGLRLLAPKRRPPGCAFKGNGCGRSAPRRRRIS